MAVDIRDLLSIFWSFNGTFYKTIKATLFYSDKKSVKTVEKLFKLISANISLITEQISFILPMWSAMMRLDHFIKRRKERLHHVKFAHKMKSELKFPPSSLMTSKRYFVLLRIHFLSFTEILVLCNESVPNNLIIKPSIWGGRKRCKLTLLYLILHFLNFL